MKVYTRIVMDRDLAVIRADAFDYEGPVSRCDPATIMLIGAGVAGGSVLGSVMNRKSPSVEAPKVMPTPDDEAMRRARRRSLASQLGRRGRQSTILSQGDETLG